MKIIKSEVLPESTDFVLDKVGIGLGLGACFGAVFGKMAVFLILGLMIGMTTGIIHDFIYIKKNKVYNG